jgi:hypothetical protein
VRKLEANIIRFVCSLGGSCLGVDDQLLLLIRLLHGRHKLLLHHLLCLDVLGSLPFDDHLRLGRRPCNRTRRTGTWRIVKRSPLGHCQQLVIVEEQIAACPVLRLITKVETEGRVSLLERAEPGERPRVAIVGMLKRGREECLNLESDMSLMAMG